MAFLELSINMTRTVELLGRIADALDRAYPVPVIPDQEPRKRSKEDLVHVTPEDRFDREMKRKIERAKAEGLPLDE